MRLDPDCLRDVLCCVEDNTGLHKRCIFIDCSMSGALSDALGTRQPELAAYQKELMEKYDSDSILYHLRYCVEDELVVEGRKQSSGMMIILDLTPKGHQFIAQIRDSGQWKKVTNGLDAVRNYSLAAISAVAEGVTSAGISAYFSGKANH